MCIHGDKSQPERDWVLTGKKHILDKYFLVFVFGGAEFTAHCLVF